MFILYVVETLGDYTIQLGASLNKDKAEEWRKIFEERLHKKVYIEEYIISDDEFTEFNDE